MLNTFHIPRNLCNFLFLPSSTRVSWIPCKNNCKEIVFLTTGLIIVHLNQNKGCKCKIYTAKLANRKHRLNQEKSSVF